MISNNRKRDYKIVETRSVNNLRSHGIEFAHRAMRSRYKIPRSLENLYFRGVERGNSPQIYFEYTHGIWKNCVLDEHCIRNFRFLLRNNYDCSSVSFGFTSK